MASLRYRSLTRDELGLLLAPGGQEEAEAWDRLSGDLHALLQLRTRTYPRPLIPEADARASIPGALDALRDTLFFEKALQNVHAVQEIERGFREGKATPELYETVDEFIEAMLDEWNAVQHYPDPPPMMTSASESNPGHARWYASGGS